MPVTPQNETDYEDLLSLWSDLESGLGILLSNPASVQEFVPRVWQYDRWLQALLERDTDVGLYLLFQLANNSYVGYSASHALVSGVLCHLIAAEMELAAAERNALVHAALTMNIAMTALQNQMAGQTEKPSTQQQSAIQSHPSQGAVMLTGLGVTDELWVDVVTRHHDNNLDAGDLHALPAAARLARILQLVDRYTVMISPRKTREGRSLADSAKSIVSQADERNNQIAQALLRTVGLCPPGTYVQLDNGQVAVVMRRSDTPNLPYIAILIDETGNLIRPPRLHQTASGSPRIQMALAAAAVREQLNHHLILQLSSYVTQNR